VDGFPKNQRFVFGQRLANRAIDVLELRNRSRGNRHPERL
jgi:hypothetical protein